MKIIYWYITGETEKNHEALQLRIASTQTEIQTGCFMNTTLEHYGYTNVYSE
jgi:hypothetical protein